MRDAGLNAAQARNCPSCDSTRTVSPLSPPPLAMADSNIQGWRRCSERSLPCLKSKRFHPRIVQADRHAEVRPADPKHARRSHLYTVRIETVSVNI